jgi:hypothetical protein
VLRLSDKAVSNIEGLRNLSAKRSGAIFRIHKFGRGLVNLIYISR